MDSKIQQEINQYFGGDQYRYFIFLRSYSRWNEEKQRRETWEEVVGRYVDFMRENVGDKYSEQDYSLAKEYILAQKVMPSMRLMWSAGEPARKSNIAAYNCSFVAIEQLKDFSDIIVISCNGCGVGFSCEKMAVEKLPTIQVQTGELLETHIVEDSKEGWANALLAGLETWYSGKDIHFDFSLVRPEGARLKTFGGKASGPEPLKRLLEFTRETILKAQGRKLKPIEVHDIVCKIGDCVVSGGVRRTALISLSDLNDGEMRDSKTGEFWKNNPQRSLSNNSAVYESKPDKETFLLEWNSLKNSGTGERGIYNRYNFNWSGRRQRRTHLTGCNPCGEINLNNRQYCNLTSIVCRQEDTVEDLINKAKVAVMLGTYQSSLTNFPYIDKRWAENCESERLLGVSLNGQMDSPVAREESTLKLLKEKLVEFNKEYSEKLGINQSTAIGAIKPEGTCSQMLNTSSGMHPRYAKHYVRRVRISSTDSLFKVLKEAGIKYSPEVWQKDWDKPDTFVLEFPIKSPEKAITRHDLTAIDQLEYWKKVKLWYTEHNPSQTIYVGSGEWDEVGEWVYENFDIIGGLSFLPREDEDHVYELAPYEEITAEKYEELSTQMPIIDFDILEIFEQSDQTSGGVSGCEGDSCSIDNVV